jgi:hypothetical protein
VSVSGAKEAESKVKLPELNVDRFLALSDARRAKLIEDNIITMVASSTKRSSRSSTPQGAGMTEKAKTRAELQAVIAERDDASTRPISARRKSDDRASLGQLPKG